MTRLERTVNLVAVVLPFVAFIAAIVLLWNSYVGVSDLVAFGVMYLIAGFGVTVGFHRLLTHRAFQTHKPVEYGFAIAGSMSVQGPVIDWVADHRKHHAHADEEGDPHSPHVQFGEGWIGERPIGSYSYAKRLKSDQTVSCTVEVFPLEVRTQHEDWPERAEREGRWFNPEEAARAVREEELREIIRRLPELVEHPAPER